jgi:hypothetical protein
VLGKDLFLVHIAAVEVAELAVELAAEVAVEELHC